MAEHLQITDFTQAEQKIINRAIDMPFNEMTEEEAALVIDWKACVKASNDTYQAVLKQNQAAILARQATDRAASELADAEYDRIVAEINARIEAEEAEETEEAEEEATDGQEE